MKKYEISIFESDEKFFAKENEVVFKALLASGSKALMSGCFGGGCGVCKIEVLEGVYKKIKPMSRAHISKNEEKQNIILLCCINAQSDLILKEL